MKLIVKIKSLLGIKAKLYECQNSICHTFRRVDGFGMDTQLYRLVSNAREKANEEIDNDPKYRLPTREDFKETFDTRTGFAIDGTALCTGYHPWHDNVLIKKETGEKYIIDLVSKHHYYGSYWVIMFRKEGTKSHGTIFWENIDCHDPTMLEGIEDAHLRFDMVDAKSLV